MKVVFDNIVFSQRVGGVSIVWYELLKRVLSNNDLDSIFLEYKSYNNMYRNRLNIPDNAIITMSDWGFRFAQFLNPTVKVKDRFIFHSSYYRIASNKKAVNVTTVHDFIYEYFSRGLRKTIHCRQKYRSIRQSKAVICISENTKKDLLKFMPHIKEDNIYVVYHGVSDDFYPVHEKPSHIPYTSNFYALYVGSRASYKNFDLTVRAVAASKLNLVIVGSPLSEKEKQFLDAHLGTDRYNHTGYVEPEALNKLYNMAYALLYPSSYEGFGIPVLEAQKAGCPVIAFNASSIPEIIGDTPLLLNELTVEAILKCFEILSDKETRNTVIRNGLENTKRFSWDAMYARMMQIYHTVWNDR